MVGPEIIWLVSDGVMCVGAESRWAESEMYPNSCPNWLIWRPWYVGEEGRSSVFGGLRIAASGGGGAAAGQKWSKYGRMEKGRVSLSSGL
jgi:hypothetical protein